MELFLELVKFWSGYWELVNKDKNMQAAKPFSFLMERILKFKAYYHFCHLLKKGTFFNSLSF
jgi:hypothetical protein